MPVTAGALLCAHTSACLFFPLLFFRADVFVLRLWSELALGPPAALAELTLAAQKRRAGAGGEEREGGSGRVWLAAELGPAPLLGEALPPCLSCAFPGPCFEQHPPAPPPKIASVALEELARSR